MSVNVNKNGGKIDHMSKMLENKNVIKGALGSNVYIRKSFIESIKQGSNAASATAMQEVAVRNLSKIVGENIQSNIHPICTFKKHAIFSDDFSNLYRLEFDGGHENLELVKVEKIDERKFTEDEIEKELENVCSESLSRAIAKSGAECDNKLKEDLSNLLGFMADKRHENFLSLINNNQY